MRLDTPVAMPRRIMTLLLSPSRCARSDRRHGRIYLEARSAADRGLPGRTVALPVKALATPHSPPLGGRLTARDVSGGRGPGWPACPRLGTPETGCFAPVTRPGQDGPQPSPRAHPACALATG